MGDFTGIFAIFAIFCIFVAPLWLIMHYTSKRRQAHDLTGEDERMPSDVWQLANRMEGRVKTMESILDKQAPRWRDDA